MHIDFGNALVIAALISAVMLVLGGGERAFPVIAVIAAGIEALIAFHIISISSGRFRIDIILPAVLLVAGAVCWHRCTSKTATTASTIVSLVAVIQLLVGLHVLD